MPMDELDRRALGCLLRVVASPVLLPYWCLRGVVRGIARIFTALAEEKRQRQYQLQEEINRKRRSEAQAKQRDEQRLREEARLECELLYARHASEIGGRFPRTDFEQFIAKYMRDDLTPADVQQRGRQLQMIIQQHVEKIAPPPKFQSLEDLAGWFAEQRRQLEAVADDRMRQALLVQLNERYAELTTQFLEETQS